MLKLSLPDSKKQSYNLQAMQHLPLPAPGAAHPLGGGHRRGPPAPLLARIECWPASGDAQSAAAIFSCFLTTLFFQSLKKMDSCTEHYAFWNLFILDLFLIICISELKFNVFCTDCVKEDALHLLHCVSLLKCEVKGLCALKCRCVWKHQVILMVDGLPFVWVCLCGLCHQYWEGEKGM